MKYKNLALALSLLVFLPLLSPTARAQTLIHYALHDTDSNSVAGGIIPNTGTLGNGTNGGAGITLTNDLPTNGVPPGAGNRAMAFNGAGGVLAPGIKQLNNTAIFNAGGFTYEAWFKWNGAGNIDAIIDYAGTQKLIRPTNQASVEMQYYNTNNAPVSVSFGAAPSNQWHYVAVVFTATGLDGQTNVTGNFTFCLDTNTPTASASGVKISAFGDSLNRTIGVGTHPAGFASDYFNGLIFEPRVTLGALPAYGLLFQPGVLVTTTNDSGAGSLRAAVSNAPDGAAITFAPALSGQTILLTNGQIDLGQNVTIDSSALPAGIQLNGNHSNRIFTVNNGVTASLNALTLVNGAASDYGGGVHNLGTLTVANCTFAGDSAGTAGGAIRNTGTVAINESTFAGNTSANGGAVASAGTAIINQGTFSQNSATFFGGAIFVNGPVALNNSIVAGNSASLGLDIYVNTQPLAYGGSNLVQNVGGLADFIGPAPLNAAPLLAALGNYGGPTPTMPPLAGSPAIDAGSDAATNSFATDQRGRPRLLGAHVDIGAVEVNPNTIVTTNADGVAGSLRNVIAGVVSNDLVSFAPNLSGSIITLGGAIGIANNVSVDASALPGGIILNGHDVDRVFNVSGGAAASLTALTITGGATGDTSSGGGAIFNGGTLALYGCSLYNNFAYSGFTNDPNGGPGGAITSMGSLTMIQCTLSGNFASGGSAIYNTGPLTLQQCTVASNTSTTGAGGAIFNGSGGVLLLSNSIVAANGGSSTVDVWNLRSTSTQVGANLIQNLYNDFLGTNNGTTAISAAPMLAPFGNYGGPAPTMPPLPGSPAIDSAAATPLLTDQRGYPRPVGLGPDIGAVEGIYNAAGPGIITNITYPANGFVQFAFSNLTDASFPVLATTDATQPLSNWLQIGFVSESPVGSHQFPFTDTQASSYPARYYRVKAP